MSAAPEMRDFAELVFPLAGDTLSIDYPLPLWLALRGVLPWLAEEADAGILPIKGGGHSQGRLLISQRSRLTLRLPHDRIEPARRLAGTSLDLGNALGLGEPIVRALRATSAQYSPMVAFGHDGEKEFLAECRGALEAMGVGGRLVCGRVQTRLDETGELRGFSLMVHGLNPEQALRLQQRGLGCARKVGCGIFVSHRTAVAVGAA